MNALARMLLLIIPHTGPVVTERVDYVELNRVYDEEGELRLTQWLFCDGEEIRDWRTGITPAIQYHPEFSMVFLDHKDGKLRVVRATSYQEEWLQYDRELAAREWLPECRRRKLQ